MINTIELVDLLGVLHRFWNEYEAEFVECELQDSSVKLRLREPEELTDEEKSECEEFGWVRVETSNGVYWETELLPSH
jgi:hypothetical protein